MTPCQSIPRYNPVMNHVNELRTSEINPGYNPAFAMVNIPQYEETEVENKCYLFWKK